MDSVFVVATGDLPRAKVGGVDDPSVRWAGAFAAYGGHGATQSSTFIFEIAPGGRLGWHTDATEETQYILAGTGELRIEGDVTHQVGPGSVFVIPSPVRHDLANTGKETLRAVAFFAAAMFTQQFDNVMLPPDAPPTATARLSQSHSATGSDPVLKGTAFLPAGPTEIEDKLLSLEANIAGRAATSDEEDAEDAGGSP